MSARLKEPHVFIVTSEILPHSCCILPDLTDLVKAIQCSTGCFFFWGDILPRKSQLPCMASIRNCCACRNWLPGLMLKHNNKTFRDLCWKDGQPKQKKTFHHVIIISMGATVLVAFAGVRVRVFFWKSKLAKGNVMFYSSILCRWIWHPCNQPFGIQQGCVQLFLSAVLKRWMMNECSWSWWTMNN